MMFRIIYCSKCSATVCVPVKELPMYPEEWLETTDACDCAPVTIKGRSQDFARDYRYADNMEYRYWYRNAGPSDLNRICEVELFDDYVVRPDKKVDRFSVIMEAVE